MIAPTGDSPVGTFITEICTHINPLDVARWLETQDQLDRGKFAAYVGGAIQMHFHKNQARCALLGLHPRRFTELCLARVEYVLKQAECYDTIGELQDFAKFLRKPKKFFSMPGKK